MDIEELDLGGRAYGVLKGARIDTAEDLCLFTAQQLMHLGNFGKKSLAEVQRALEEHSLRSTLDRPTLACCFRLSESNRGLTSASALPDRTARVLRATRCETSLRLPSALNTSELGWRTNV